MAENKQNTKRQYNSERQREYQEMILPKLSDEIKVLNLSMRSNTVLVNAGIHTIQELRATLERDEHIRYMDRDEEQYIRRCLRIPCPKRED